VSSAALCLIASYFVGAIPTSYLAGRLFRGIDLREHGSRNLGATNVYRTLGWKYAIPVGLFDIAKGAVPVLVFAPLVSDSQVFALACGIAAILGHVFSVFVRFKGGKGVATAAGVVLALTPAAAAIAVGVFVLTVLATRYVSLGSMLGAIAAAPAAYFLGQVQAAELYLLLAVIIVLKHAGNVRRLAQGTESRLNLRRSPDSA
jgi:glycerol-3-phosphate acyltransferase PlsY